MADCTHCPLLPRLERLEDKIFPIPGEEEFIKAVRTWNETGNRRPLTEYMEAAIRMPKMAGKESPT
jgi:hypothetical protein